MSHRSSFPGTAIAAAAALVSVLFVCPMAEANPVPVVGPYWIASPPMAPPRAPIALSFSNATPDTVYVHDTSPWWITDDLNNQVYSGGGAFAWVMPIPPGVTITWIWGQQDEADRQVDPGLYWAHIRWGETSNNPNAHEELAPIRVLDDILWRVDPREAQWGAQLTLQLRNLSDAQFVLPNEAPWSVVDTTGAVVYQPQAGLAEVNIVPGDSIGWTLDTNLLPPINAAYHVQIAIRSTLENILRRPRESIRIYDPPEQVVWTVSPIVQATRSAVSLTLTNASLDSIWIPRWPAYWIEDPSGTHVYDPWATQALVAIPPGVTATWAWNETRNDGSHAPPGDYVAKVRWGPQSNPNQNLESFRFRLVGPPDCWFVQSTDEDIWYPAGENPVHWRFTNCAPDTVGMINSGTWWIGNAVGFPVYWPEVVLQYMPRYAPGQGFNFEWPKTDQLGNQAPPPGPYYAFVYFTDKWYRTHYLTVSNPVFIDHGVVDTDPDVLPAPHVVGLTAAPNPFNRHVTLVVELGAPSTARLEVFDVRGHRLRTLLVPSPLPAGRTRVIWNGLDDAERPAPGGVYLFRLTTPAETRTTKAVLVE